MQCPCGKPAIWTIWEAPISLCSRHSRAWLASEEKKEIGIILDQFFKSYVPPVPRERTPDAHDITPARDELLRFVARVERDASIWIKIKRFFSRWFGG